ncbi:MAG TPA: hypothetical protein VF762_03670 [Blastocatellia bacterium]|jgi:hypothetical protein
MRIFFEDVRDKLPDFEADNLPEDWQDWKEPWFWVIHAGRSPRIFFKERPASAKACIDRGGGILFISASPYGGFDDEDEAKEFEQDTEKRGRIHCLRVACSSKSKKVQERLYKFLDLMGELEAWAEIPWEKAEPDPWPENLVAIYLLLKAIELSPRDAQSIRDAWDRMDNSWRKQVWVNAWSEYHEDLSLNEEDWKNAGLPLPGSADMGMPETSNLAAAVDTIMRALAG